MNAPNTNRQKPTAGQRATGMVCQYGAFVGCTHRTDEAVYGDQTLRQRPWIPADTPHTEFEAKFEFKRTQPLA